MGDSSAGGTLSRRGQRPNTVLWVMPADSGGREGRGTGQGRGDSQGRGLMVTTQGLVSGQGVLVPGFPTIQWDQITPGVASLTPAWPGTEGHRAQSAPPEFRGGAAGGGKDTDLSPSYSGQPHQLPKPVPAVHGCPAARGAGGRAAAVWVPVPTDR